MPEPSPNQPSAILLAPQLVREEPLSGTTLRLPELDQSRRDKINFNKILEAHRFVSLEDFMKVEKGLRLGASNYNVCEFPSKREQAANYSHDTLRQSGVVVLINGIPTIKQRAIADYAAAATKFYGKPVLVVVNDEERFIDSPLSGVPGANVLRSVGNSIAGLRNADWGAAREASVLRSAYVLEDLAKAKIPVTFVLHSQGSIIGSNSLTQIMRHAPKGRWDEVRANTKVEAYGPAQLRFPEGIDVKLRAFDQDPIFAKGAALADWVKDRPLVSEVLESDLAKFGRKVVALPGSNHDFDSHLEKLHRYFVIEKVNNHYTKANGMALADEFVKSVATAQFSDRVYDSLLSLMPKLYHYRDPESVPVKERANYQDFVLAFRDRLAAHRTAGNLGKYEIPEGLREALGIAK